LLVTAGKKRNIEHILVMLGAIGNVALGAAEVSLRNATPQATWNYTQAGALVFIVFNTVALALYFRRAEAELEATKEAEQRLAANNAALDRVHRFERNLMANLTHEMRTPLAVMSSYAQLAVKDIEKLNADPQTTEDLKVIQDEAKRLAELASGFLDIYQQQGNTKSRSSLSIGSLLEQAGHLCTPMLKRKRNRLVLSLAEDLPPAYANANEIIQVVLNLITNANNHTEGGEISISADAGTGGQFSRPFEERTRELTPCPAEVIVTIADTGEGIDPELLPQIFERGVTDGGGSGLGLDICRQVVEAHGGTISIESSLGEGTTVWFSLPVLEEGTSGE